MNMRSASLRVLDTLKLQQSFHSEDQLLNRNYNADYGAMHSGNMRMDIVISMLSIVLFLQSHSSPRTPSTAQTAAVLVTAAPTTAPPIPSPCAVS